MWQEGLIFLFHSEVKFLVRFDVFLDLVILCILMQFLYISMRLSALSALIKCNFHVYNWENANIKDLNA